MFFNTINAQDIGFEKSESFYGDVEILNKEEINWGYVLVPENWDNPNSKIIKIAVAILKNKSKKDDADAVVFIQGGPGASGVQSIGTWLNHPLRKQNDIVLMDARGTGFSEPRLCPNLGEKFLKILAKNQSVEEDEQQKIAETLICRQELLNKGINISTYNSLSVAKDLNAIKSQLKYSDWHVYGVSYGTYMAQVYASLYPEEIKTLILDSPVEDLSTYYKENTSNYMSSLQKVFEKCNKDPECNSQYPDLENVYYKNISNLEKNPITVSVEKDLIDTEEFTYNAEDYKVAIQQALYNKNLIEVIPLLIYQFHNENTDALGNLVPAFSSLLEMDYGVYYSVSCNETLPNNVLSKYNSDASQFKDLKGGVSFYKSDFMVCDEWNKDRKDSLTTLPNTSNLSSALFPVMVLSGKFDPITPFRNGEKIANKFKNGYLISAPNSGHVPGFSKIGQQVVKTFIDNPNIKPDLKAFNKGDEINFAKNIKLNSGISKMGNSLNQMNLLFLSPLLVALILMIAFSITYSIKLSKRKYKVRADKIVRSLGILISAIGVIGIVGFTLALLQVLDQNYIILAFGLPENFTYLFIVTLIFIILLVLTLLYFFIKIRSINERSIVFSLIFSNILVATYIIYWGII